MRLDVERLVTVLVVLLTIIVCASVSVSGALKLTVTDLHVQAAIARAEQPPPSRSPLGQRLSAAFASDLAPGDAAADEARALELDHRADRLLELTAVVALLGMLLALVTGRPANEVAHAREATRPLASTSSNGTV
jgi:hypothetical protein